MMTKYQVNFTHRFILFAALAAFLVLGARPAWAQETAPIDGLTAVVNTPDTSPTVGDPIPVEIAVTHPAGYRLIPTDPSQSWLTAGLPLELSDSANPAANPPITIVDNGDGTQTSRQTVLLTAWEPGAFALPSLTMSISDAQGNLRTITTAPATLEVASVLVDGDTTLRDIKPQATLPAPSVWPVTTAVVILLTATTGALVAFVIWRKNRPTPDTRPAFQRALDDLTRLDGLNLIEQNMAQAHVTFVTDVLRRYLEADFDIPALDQTTTQIVAALAHNPQAQQMPPAEKAALVALLQEADLVKFANVEPDLDTAVNLTAHVRHLILAIRPAPLLENQLPNQHQPTITEATAS